MPPTNGEAGSTPGDKGGDHPRRNMRILVFSDLHGQGYRKAGALVEALAPDWVVVCGDMLPDFNRISGRERRLEAQRDFWRAWRTELVRDGTPVTMVRGNHEIEGFRDAEMERLPIDLEGRILRLEGIPGEFGRWGFSREWDAAELQTEMDAQSALAPAPRFILSHVPPYGSLDRTHRGEHIGHRHLFRWLREQGWPPVVVFCGHVHQGFGWERQGETLVVNSATGYALVEAPAGGEARVLEMGRLLEGVSPWDDP